MNVLRETRSGGVLVRLIEHSASSFVITGEADNLTGLFHFTTDRAQAEAVFYGLVQLAAGGLAHPAWRQRA